MIREILLTAAITAVVLVLLIVLLMFTAGATQRDPAQVRAFRKDHPCPSTWDDDGPVPRLGGRSHQAAGVRRTRRAEQYAVANDRGCEGEGQG